MMFRACGFTPLCPVGHLPHKGGDRMRLRPVARNNIALLGMPEGKEQSPPLWGRCHEVTEGGKASPRAKFSVFSAQEAAHAPHF